MEFCQCARQLAGQAMTLLGWTPETFWDATPEDVAMALGAMAGGSDAAPVDGALLAQLKERFPDG